MDQNIMQLTVTNKEAQNISFSHDPRILFLLRGKGTVQIDGKRWPLKTEDFVTVNSGAPFSYELEPDSLLAQILLNYRSVSAYLSLDRNILQVNSFGTARRGQEVIRRLLRRIVSYYGREAGEEAPLLQALYMELLYELKRNGLANKPVALTQTRQHEAANEELIREYLEQHYLEKISLKDLAEETFFSEAYLSRYIKRHFGVNFLGLLTNIRLNHARELLKETDETIIKVAMDSGFPNTAAMNRAFQEIQGETPSEYRRREQFRLQQRRELEQEHREAVAKKVEEYLDEKGLVSQGKTSMYVLSAQDGHSKRLDHFWSRMVNGGKASDLLRADTQEHILFLKKEIGFTYIRFWDLWSPELKLYDGNEQNRFSFSGLDQIIRFLYQNGLIPYIDLGFKPVQLMSKVKDVMTFEDRKSPFRDADAFAGFAGAMLRHYSYLYGPEYVEKWILEFWYDTKTEDCAEYLEIFRRLKTRVKEEMPAVKIGGGGTNREVRPVFRKLTEAWKEKDCLPDFISVYAYPFDNGFLIETPGALPENALVWKGPDYNRRFLEKTGMILEENGLKGMHLHLTEWNFTFWNRDSVNDSVFKGAYVVKNLMDMSDQVDMAGYWVGSDLFSGHYDSTHLLSGAGGLLTRDRICKPAFYGLQFLSQLYDYLLARDDHSIVTTNRRFSYRIVSHNYCHPNERYYTGFDVRTSRENIQSLSECFDEEEREFCVMIQNVPSGRYYVKKRLLDRHHGSVQDEWNLLGYTDMLNEKDMEYLRRICVPQITMETTTVENGQLRLEYTLQSNAIISIHVFRAD